MSYRPKRISADLPQHWLDDPVMFGLSDGAWRLYTGALMWCIGRTNGQVPWQMVSRLTPGSDSDRQVAIKELIEAELVSSDECALWVENWDEHQSTVEQIQDHRRKLRERVAKYRAKKSGNGTRNALPNADRNGSGNPVSTERNGREDVVTTGESEAITRTRETHAYGRSESGGTCHVCQCPVPTGASYCSDHWATRDQHVRDIDPWASQP